ncbi:hypothetical protein LJR164_003844 [Phenylobacterium sp. LjRoot164]|uniref:hypothetical protein n=1 Tax=unclassified Phenylobacterium TaxID=2640670 RepID=UPI003ED103D0
MQRRELAQAIATSLFETEAALDAALERAALLIAQTSALRREHNYSAVLGHEAVAALTRTIDALGEARGHTMSAHAAFEKASPQLGVQPATLHGTGVEKPPTGVSETEGPTFRAVASAA